LIEDNEIFSQDLKHNPAQNPSFSLELTGISEPYPPKVTAGDRNLERSMDYFKKYPEFSVIQLI